MKKRVLSLFLALTLCLTLTPTGALAAEGQPPEQTVSVTQETEPPTPAPQKEEPTAPAENGADENASPAGPDEKPTENTPAAPEKNPADEEPGKEAGQNEPTAEGKNEPLALGLDDAEQNAAEGENGEGSGGTHYVAESGGTHYETVQKILEEWEGEITLLDSVKEDLTVYAPTTINMNGHSITGSIYATDSLTLNGGTVNGTVNVDGGTFTMTAPSDAAAAIDGELNVISGSAYVSGAKIGVNGTLVFGGTDMTITGTERAVALDKAAEPNGVKLYGSTDVNGETSDEAVFNEEQSTYTVSGEAAKKLSTTQVNGEPEPEKPTLTINPTSANANAGETATFTAKDPELTYIVSGVLSGETLKGITLARAEGENAGQYAITATADAGANPNYEVTFAKGTLTIEPKSIKGAKVVLGKGLTANGAEQTQTVEKVLLDDKEIPADSYTVAGNTATAPGRYTLTVTAKGNYTGTVEQTYAIAYKDTAVPSSSKPSSNNSSNDSETKKNEVAAPTPAPTPASTSKPSTITAMPQTGDTSNPTLYVVLLVASLLGLAVVFVCKKRNDK